MVAIEILREALRKELRRQAENSGAISFYTYGDDTGPEIGVDGTVNLDELAKVVRNEIWQSSREFMK